MGSFAAPHGKKSIPLWQQTGAAWGYMARGDRFQLPTSENLSDERRTVGRTLRAGRSCGKYWNNCSISTLPQRHGASPGTYSLRNKMRPRGWMNRENRLVPSMRAQWVGNPFRLFGLEKCTYCTRLLDRKRFYALIHSHSMLIRCGNSGATNNV